MLALISPTERSQGLSINLSDSPLCGLVVREAIVYPIVGDIRSRVVHIDQVRTAKESCRLHEAALLGEVTTRDIDGGPGGSNHRITSGDGNRSASRCQLGDIAFRDVGKTC